MRLLDSLRRRGTLEDAAAYGAQSVLWQSMVSGSPDVERMDATFPSFAGVGYSGNGVVHAVMNARLTYFSQARFKWRRLSDEALFGNQDLLVLEQPWPGGSTQELLARMIQDVDLSGNAFIRRVGDRLERLRPDWVLIVSGEDEDTDVREVTGYVYYDGGIGVDDDPMLLPVEDVAHWSPVPDPLAAYRGMSWLTPVVREIDADSAMVVHKGKFFVNGATPNLLVKYPSVIGPETLDRLKTQIQSRFAGSENAYKTMVLDQGADVTVIGSQMAEMAFTAVQSAGESRIAAAGGVPPIVAHLQAGLESTSYAYAREALKTFLHGTLHYLWVSASQTLSKLVVVPAGCELYYDRTDIPALRESEVERQNANQAAAATIASLVMQGFTPQSSVAATVAADLSLLQHSGALSVQLYPNGEAPPVLEAVASEPPVINVDARTSVAEGAFQMTMPVDARTETHTTIADGAVRASIDGTTHVEVDPGAVQVTNEITQAQPAAVRKQVETDEAGRITAIVETPAG